MSSLPKNLKGNDTINDSQDREAMELYSRAKAQQEEIIYLREQIALASVRESQLLNEKYGLEKKFSELCMALDEKQSEAIICSSKKLARRKGDIEENLRLVNELKDPTDQTSLDNYMVHQLGGTQNEWGRCNQKLGANSILAVSLVVRKAGAAVKNISLYKPPISMERVSELGQWQKRKVKARGTSWDINSMDVAVVGLGWFSLGLKGEADLTLWTYDGLQITLQ